MPAFPVKRMSGIVIMEVIVEVTQKLTTLKISLQEENEIGVFSIPIIEVTDTLTTC
jgi:hypothetical protein